MQNLHRYLFLDLQVEKLLRRLKNRTLSYSFILEANPMVPNLLINCLLSVGEGFILDSIHPSLGDVNG